MLLFSTTNSVCTVRVCADDGQLCLNYFMIWRTIVRIVENGKRSSGLSAQHFSINSNRSGGQLVVWHIYGRNGVVSCAATRSKMAAAMFVF